MKPRIGVYVCHCGTNIAGVVNVEEVTNYAATLPDVVVARDMMYTCSDPGQNTIKEDIEKHGLNRVVIAACSPKMHENTFRKTLASAGLNPYLLEIANIREQVSWAHFRERDKATEKAKVLVKAAVAKARLLEPLEKKEMPVERSVLVIGGGVAGIQAALDLAEAGLKVYLVEKSPSIGGHMAQLNKTFPTIDCSACILTPKMVDVANHPNITLLAYSEVVKVEGYVGNFEATILRKARYVDEDLCAGCGACADACPRKVPNEFDVGLGKRKAIYVPFPQAVPLKYTIDPASCLYMKYGRCKLCVKACPRGAINFDQKDEEVKVRVGAIIVAVGFKVFDARKIPSLGYGKYKNVITGIELERLSNASGPTGGVVLTASGERPKSVAFIQCVGSRDLNHNSWCCRIGCMATLKQA
ncbi:MAG: CoB--CoM heterodisulfide reductase iron-sulfur subunit A family protein, partial [Candidatus Jordarchaeales archaeon]